MKRRIPYLQYILNEDDDETISKILKAQIKSPLRNDWVEQVKEDLKELDLKYGFVYIICMKEATLRKY